MSNSIIREYFESKIKTYADSQTPKIPVSYENLSFTKPSEGVFLETFLLPSVTINPEVSAQRQRYLGIFQVNCWARSGRSMKQVEKLAENIINLFPILPKENVSIESTPFAESSLLDNSGWIVLPVIIKYRYES